MAQFRVMGIILGTSQHPMDVPFVLEFSWEVRFRCYKPSKKPNFGDRCHSYPLYRMHKTAQHIVFFMLALHGSLSLSVGSTPSLTLYFSGFSDPL